MWLERKDFEEITYKSIDITEDEYYFDSDYAKQLEQQADLSASFDMYEKGIEPF